MRILLYGINYYPEPTGIGRYSGEKAIWLARQGHEVRVITAFPYYPDWQVADGYGGWYNKTIEDGVRVVRCPLYVPKKLTKFKRLAHLVSFAVSSFFPLISQVFWRPDLVIQVAPSLVCSPQALLLARMARSQSILHVQDFEVNALFGLMQSRTNLPKRIILFIERILLKRFDRVSTISDGMLELAKGKGIESNNLLKLPNWSETHRFQGLNRDDGILKSIGVDPSKSIVLYSGNMGEKQGLDLIILAARCLQKKKNIHFLLVGDGAEKERLVTMVESFSLVNVTFAPLQPNDVFPLLLASADCHLVLQKRFPGEAFFPSKLTNILAVGGNSLISADRDTTLAKLCEEHPGIAKCIEPESLPALVDGIEAILKWRKPNHIASNYARDNLDKEAILTRFIRDLEGR